MTTTATLYEHDRDGGDPGIRSSSQASGPSPDHVAWFDVLPWTDEELAVLGAGKKLSGSAWLERHGVRIDGARAVPLDLTLTPYLREVADCCTDPSVRSVDFRCSTQLGKSTLLRTMIACWMDQAPGNVLLGFPKDSDAHEWNRMELTPTFERTPALRRLLPPPGTDEFRQRVQLGRIVTAAGTVFAVGLQKANNAKRRVCRYIAIDEADEVPDDVDEQGDPLKLAEERQRTLTDRAFSLITGTFTTAAGRLWRRRQGVTDRRRFFVPCPHCAEHGVMAKRRDPDIHGDSPVFEMGWSKGLGVEHADRLRSGDLDDSVWLTCPHCSEKVYEHHRRAMVARGRFVSAVPDPGNPDAELAETIDADGVIHSVSPDGEEVRFAPVAAGGAAPDHRVSRFRRARAGFTVGCFCSPWLTLGLILAEFFEAKAAGAEALKNYINSWLAEPWRETAARMSKQALRARCVAPEHQGGNVTEWARLAGLDRLEPGELPPWAKMLTMACDTQQDGWWWSVMAWGTNRRRHLVARGFAPGAAADLETGKPEGWLELERIWGRVWETPDRMAQGPESPPLRLMVDVVGIDSGGDKTYEVYDLCAEFPDFLWPTKGRDVGGVRQGDNIYKLVRVPYQTASGVHVGGVASLMELDVNQVKTQVARDLRAHAMAPGAVTFHAGCLRPDDDTFAQLTAEERVTELVGRPGRGRARDARSVWRARRGDNHEFDLQVIHVAVATRRGAVTFTGATPLQSSVKPEPSAAPEAEGSGTQDRDQSAAERAAPRVYRPSRLPGVRDGFAGGGGGGGGVGGGPAMQSGLTCSQVARCQGVSRQSVSAAERGALHKLYRGILADPVLGEAMRRLERLDGGAGGGGLSL